MGQFKSAIDIIWDFCVGNDICEVGFGNEIANILY